jgi:hypothetical protein
MNKMIDIVDKKSLIEKIMAHFGWYKCKMVEFPVTRMETNFIVELPEPEQPLEPEQPPEPPIPVKKTAP